MTLATLTRATVVERRSPMAGAIELALHHPEAALLAEPGQFFQLEVEAPQTILRRPYSISWTDPATGQIGFIFNVVGAGSAWLASLESGDRVDLIGPLGRGFTLEASDRPVVCIAGGLGVATFPAMVEAVVKVGRPVRFLQGARTAGQLLPATRLRGAEMRLATDDGSAGLRGTVLDLLATESLSDADVFACGPTPMLRGLIDAAHRLDLPQSSIQVALETPMGCGFGTCLGCVTPKRGGGYLLTCIDGPCIRADRIDWDRMANTFHG
ncbi:MAG: dihydroorotate dehydrogenase electron transfer subunit [Candidatus Dormibacteria bacterium]